ncbi:MAG: DUF4160 domain-containing protein [Solirubrobacteraceae bacterium]
MPKISFFYGILIHMYWNEGHHMTPHFHAEYGDHDASIAFDGTVLGGSLPPRSLRFVRQWASDHQAELTSNWERARRREPLEAIDPLL